MTDGTKKRGGEKTTRATESEISAGSKKEKKGETCLTDNEKEQEGPAIFEVSVVGVPGGGEGVLTRGLSS